MRRCFGNSDLPPDAGQVLATVMWSTSIVRSSGEKRGMGHNLLTPSPPRLRCSTVASGKGAVKSGTEWRSLKDSNKEGKKGRKGGRTGGKLEKKEIGTEASPTILPSNFDYKSTNVGERVLRDRPHFLYYQIIFGS